MILIVDSFAWIEFLAGSRPGRTVREILADADHLVTPDIVLAEVARKLARDGIESRLVRKSLEELGTLSQIVPINLDVAMGVNDAEAELRDRAKARKLQPPGLADSVILSLTRAVGGKVLTGDRHFEGLADTIWLNG